MPSQSTDELREDVLGLIENVAGWASGMNTNGNPETVADDIMHLINSEVLSMLDELESKSTQEFPMSSGDNVPFVPLSAIQKLKEKYQ